MSRSRHRGHCKTHERANQSELTSSRKNEKHHITGGLIMPNYQLLCIFKNLPKAELINGIRAAATCVLEHNGIIKSFENLGLRRLPIRLSGNDMQIYREGHYVFINFISGTTKLYELMGALKREGDILRRVISNEDEEEAANTCHCDKYGYFVTDIVDYTKPLTVWNKKITDPLYKTRL